MRACVSAFNQTEQDQQHKSCRESSHEQKKIILMCPCITWGNIVSSLGFSFFLLLLSLSSFKYAYWRMRKSAHLVSVFQNQHHQQTKTYIRHIVNLRTWNVFWVFGLKSWWWWWYCYCCCCRRRRHCHCYCFHINTCYIFCLGIRKWFILLSASNYRCHFAFAMHKCSLLLSLYHQKPTANCYRVGRISFAKLSWMYKMEFICIGAS